MLLLSFLERRVLNISRTCTEFLAPVSVRNRISFQCFLLPAHCLFKQHRYMNCENEAGVYARPESQDQFRSSHRRCFIKIKKNS